MKTVTKRDLVERIGQRRPDLKLVDIRDTIGLMFEAVTEALVDDKRVELRDFGVFTPKVRKARMARNPKTGDSVQVPATKVCTFKVGKEMKEKLANSYKEPEADGGV